MRCQDTYIHPCANRTLMMYLVKGELSFKLLLYVVNLTCNITSSFINCSYVLEFAKQLEKLLSKCSELQNSIFLLRCSEVEV